MMAAYNGFPATYQPVYYPQQYQPQPMQYQPQPVQPQQPTQPQMQQPVPQPVSTGIIWVQGEAGAKSHLVAPNTTVPLWDSEAQRIFLKSADPAGMPSMKILNYTIEEVPSIGAPVQRAVNAPVAAPAPDKGFVGKEDAEALKRQLEAFKGDLESIRSEMDGFKADLYGIAGKKSTGKKKEGGSDE